jgi:TRAP-type transport system periplasmic protein
MRKGWIALGMSLTMLTIPGGSWRASANRTQYIRVASLAPRDSDLSKRFLKLDRKLRSVTNNAWGLRLYPGGVAGDEPDVLRKMRIGQIDASSITTTGLSQIVREVAVLDTPGVINDYAQFTAVTNELRPQWDRTFAQAGFELIAWGETGQYRWFSKSPVRSPSDLRNVRPWVWPASWILKEIYHVIGCNGVPLGVPEVYGALQTGMIDAVISTSVALVSLQWHGKLSHVTEPTFGVLANALVMSRDRWKMLPPEAARVIERDARSAASQDRVEVRQADRTAYARLLERGYTADKFTSEGRAEYTKMEKEVRERLVGRLYPRDLLTRVMKIAAAAHGGGA